MTRTFVVDTNVVVAELITGASDSPVRRVLDGMLAGAFRFLLSPDLLAEYRKVLLRIGIRQRHGLTEGEVDTILEELAVHAQIRDPSATRVEPAPDRGDDHLWQLLVASPGAVLVTGDRRLVEQPPTFASVVSPRAALDLLSTRGRTSARRSSR